MKTLIFDFDGTLADTFVLTKDIFNEVADKYRLQKITEEDVPELKNKSAREVFQMLGVPLIRLTVIAMDVKNRMSQRMSEAKAVKGIRKTLISLKSQGYQLGIVTSNLEGNVQIFLERNKIKCFDFIYSEKSIFGKGKIIKNLLKKKLIKMNSVIYIGDEVRDIDAAREARIPIVAVSWGFNTKERLLHANPDAIVSNPNNLIEQIGNLL